LVRVADHPLGGRLPHEQHRWCEGDFSPGIRLSQRRHRVSGLDSEAVSLGDIRFATMADRLKRMMEEIGSFE
jgi:hypothetical protein